MAVAWSLSAGVVLGATSTATVTPSPAQPGDEVTVAIHVFGGGFWGTDLYLYPSPVPDSQSEGHCGDREGAVAVGTVTWTHDADGLNHDAAGHFTLPAVPDGEYALGLELGFVIPPCFPAGSLIVGAHPDTAMKEPIRLPLTWLILAIFASLMFVAVNRARTAWPR